MISSEADEEKAALPPENVAVVDAKTFDVLNQLAQLGIISFNQSLKMEIKPPEEEKTNDLEKRKNFIQPLHTEAVRKLKMSDVLISAGFEKEAATPAMESLNLLTTTLWNLTLADINKLSNSLPEKSSLELLALNHPDIRTDLDKIVNPTTAYDFKTYAESAKRLKFEIDKFLTENP